ncbi:MAG TPA: ABC transporter permease [bacterium]|nr:ABC transporter permease [Candidatus Omnitrophota bacterium]HOJ61079.1 ABC transporter permease [bacterium]HOL95595.1 ABC transporter permease [bacterium]HPO99651.1 ABC transporter permease [bacterium]HXK92857.1 ABC transporter permease [bacterium]
MKLTGCIAILHKELIHMARDPATLIFSMLPPIVQVIAFGIAIDTDVRDLATAVYDQDGKEQSRNFIQALVNSDVYKISEYVSSHEELIRSLVEGRAVVGVEIPPDFTDRYKAGQSASAAVYLDGSNNTIALQAMATANGIGLQSLIEQLGQLTGQAHPVPPLDVRPRVLFNPDLLSANFFVPGIIGVAIQLSLTMLVAFAIVREREIGTLEQLMVSPATRFALLLGKLIPYVGLAYIQIGLLLLAMRLCFGIPVHGSVVLLLALSGIFAIAVIGIGLIISTAAKNQVQATQLAIATLLPSIFLSGFIYPRDTMPLFFYVISFCLPLTYFLEIVRGIVLRGAEFINLISSVIPLSFMAVILFTLSVIKFRKRLD